MVDINATRKTSTVPEITPLDRYDFGRAKIHASVRWLLVTAYGSGGKIICVQHGCDMRVVTFRECVSVYSMYV